MRSIGVFKKSLLLAMLLVPAAAQALPEIPFCPAGGPPGWFNRITDDHYDGRRAYYRATPAYYAQPVMMPYWAPPAGPNTYQPYMPSYPPPAYR